MGRNYCGQMTRAGTRGGLALARGRGSLTQSIFEEKNMSELETFRAETRAWLEENCPTSMRTPMPEREMPWGGRNASYPNPDTKVWMDNMASRG